MPTCSPGRTAVALALACTLGACAGQTSSGGERPTSASAASTGSSPAPTTAGAGATGAATHAATDAATHDVVSGLSVPWSVAVLPMGGFLVSERDTARILRIDADGHQTDLGQVPDVAPAGEGGLLGLAVRPAEPTVVYAYATSPRDNRVLAIPLNGNALGAPRTVLTGIPKGSIHNGGRIAFGPDGYLYIGTGEAGNRPAAQDRGSLGGKILRVTTDGVPAPGNPFDGSPVWSLGHRNVQGFDWDSAGRMWASEFGQDTWDELNLIRPGSNYGWPLVEGRAGRAGYVDPVAQWKPADASPSGLTIGPDGAVYLAALRGQSLWRVLVRADGTAQDPQRLLEGRYGRLRDVLIGIDGRLWVVTSNTFRGTPRAGDDRIISLDPGDLR
ncbi:MAG: PQQ-dependent sugar dehydrogenase [Dermatophilaceae bacterium]